MIEKIGLGLLGLAVGVVPTMVLLTIPALAESGVEEKVTQESVILAQAGTLADVTVRLEDLPQGFTAMPPAELANLKEQLSQDGIDVENVFAFVGQEQFQLIMGITTRLETAQQRAEFDELLRDPEKLKSLLAENLEETNAPPQALNNINNIGDAAAGVSLRVDLDGLFARLEILVLRKNQMGAFVFVLYRDSQRPLYPIAEVGRLLDRRAQEVQTRRN
ncbi:hypothetical protein [Oscillatoria acuminata]|uniref:DUF1400 domain-containing protein n=1 Tax=Oscillatoria acuminata PCC 6304 TaxID=56110 RepID=K9TFA3_9CYAN|nr:hypothetical protein [Oscillatoria acuminata]AFY80704.1 hypothetical protein Oscil6304_0975 [Oscillatoria acuminata PCC 6304]